MTVLFCTSFFALGAVIASFVGVLAGRLYTGQGIVAGRSRCDCCGATLAPLSLVPILSYLFGGGRARCCGARISLLAPLSELALGTLYMLSYLRLGLSLALPVTLVLLAVLAALVLYDLAHQILPPSLLAVFLLVAAAFAYLTEPPSALMSVIVVALAIAAFFALLWGASLGRAMGLADSPLALGLALFAGRAALVGLLLSFWIGAIVGIALLAIGARGATMKSEVPFAPFLALGFLLAYFTQWDPFSITAILAALLGGALP